MSEFEVIIVDDGSTRAVDEAQLRQRYPLCLKVVRRDREPGAHESRYAGVLAAAGTRVLFLDDDVVFESGLLAAHASVDQDFGLGPILYHPDSAPTPYIRMQTRGYAAFADKLVSGPRRTTTIELCMCNVSGPTGQFRELIEGATAAMRGLPTLTGGFDEYMIGVEFKSRSYAFRILPDAVVLHFDTKTLEEARRGQMHNGAVSCRLALEPAANWPDVGGYLNIADVLTGKQRFRRYKAKLVWAAPRLSAWIAYVLTWIADRGPPRWVPMQVCYAPLAIAFWQGVRSVAPSYRALRTALDSRQDEIRAQSRRLPRDRADGRATS